MAWAKSKWVTLIIAMCFAILQAMQPLIHAHLDADHPIHNSGFHMGDDHEEAAHESTITPQLSEEPHVSHTISVASGIKKDLDLSLVDPLYAAAIFVIITLLLIPPHNFDTHFTPRFRQFLRRLSPAPRAPPLF